MYKTKETGILMTAGNGPKVHRGTKTQTRRPMKQQPLADLSFFGYDTETGEAGFGKSGRVFQRITCPYGRPGDRLWIRESFYAFGHWFFGSELGNDAKWRFVDQTREKKNGQYFYTENPPNEVKQKRAKGVEGWYLRPALFMPRAVSRTNAILTDVRAQRIQDITEADALAEGADPLFSPEEINDPVTGYHLDFGEYSSHNTARESFASLYALVNKDREAWKRNDWVWALTFEKVEPK